MAPKADPDVLRELVDRYDRLRSLDALMDFTARPGIEGTVYTLCVLTGVRDETKALATARRLLTHPSAEPIGSGLDARGRSRSR
ncbi:DUF5133 domain-containing protein [Streptomyces sp. NPDC127068]|uniref:DUF5133 domain-containing protein n=1 Tax=Streptomyces sp. NPDC127068 TaxID=3347127 RepID=UPI00365FC799